MSEDAATLREAEHLIDRLREKLAESRASRREAIAVVGLAARTPFESVGVQFWEGLSEGIDTSKTIPRDRWDADAEYDPEKPGKSRTKRGHFLSDVTGFDASFFGIAPIEAHMMDPQQRLVLETAWEALSDAGSPLESLQRIRTGVFLGGCGSDYAHLSDGTDLPAAYGSYRVTGAAMSVIAGRVSYALGLSGPSLIVDTACSSSLAAVHLACDSLRARASDVALAGGVNLMLSPQGNRVATSIEALSPDGRCRSFDAKGEGFARGEGCGIVVLKRLSDAVRDGDRVLALIRGSALNQDGRSDGLTAPSGRAQQAVIRAALDFAKLTPGDVQYVEAHGTGTVLGDPIEVEALGEVFGDGHTKTEPLVIGSVKSNFGHLEGAAGVAGLIKLILSIQHRELPPSLHFQTPNPHIPWDKLAIRVQKKLGPWPSPDKPLIGGVSSFGISGTNAHVIVGEVETENPEPWRESDRLSVETKYLPLCVSAKTPEALRAYAKRFAEYLAAPLSSERATTWRDVAFTSSVRQTHHEHRLVVVGTSPSDWADKLRAHAEGHRRHPWVAGEANAARSRVVFVFPGHGAQWLGMGRSLLESSAVFREVIERCEAALRPHVDWSLKGELLADESSSRLAELDVIQPMLFAFQVALAAVWERHGVEPSAVVGHSMGEVAAAHVAGALTLEDAARVVCTRSKLLRRIHGRGAMVTVDLPMAETERELAVYGGKLSVASSNSPRLTVVSGDTQAVAALTEALTKRGIVCRPAISDVAGHSAQIDELRDDLLRELGAVRPSEPTIRFVSTALPEPTMKPAFDAAYWWTNLRDPVRLSQRVSELLEQRHELFVEISPQPLLALGIDETIQAARKPGRVIASLRLQKPEAEMIVEALGELHVAGYPVSWKTFYSVPGRVVSLPSYPWQRQRFWLPVSKTKAHVSDSKWSLVHRHYSSSDQAGKHVFEVELDTSDAPYAYLADYKVRGDIVLPAAAYLEMALEAASMAFEGKVASVADLQLSEPLMLTEGGTVLQLVVKPAQDGSHAIRIASRAKKAADEAWQEHAHGRLVVHASREAAPRTTLGELQKRCARAVDVSDLYESFESANITYGPGFEAISEAWAGEGEALSKLEDLAKFTEHASGYVVFPVLLEAVVQTLAVMRPLSGQAYVASTVGALNVYGAATPRWAYVKERSTTDTAITIDALLFDEGGRVVAEVEGLRAVPPEKGRDKLDDWLFEVAWRPSAMKEADAAKGRWLILADEQGIAAGLRTWLEARGGDVRTVRREGDMTSAEGIVRFLKEAYGKAGPTKIVSLFALDTRAVGSPLNEESVQRAQDLTCTSTLHLTQALAQVAWSDPPRLFLVTRGAQAATGSRDVVFPEQALAWGFGAALAHEMAELKTTLIDLEQASTPEALGRELAGADEETRVALRGTSRFVTRLVRHTRPTVVAGGLRPLKVGVDEGYTLEMLEPGRLDSLTLRPAPVPKPGPGQVVIKAQAVGLDLEDGRLPVARDCAGVVFAVGEGMSTVRVGDEVVSVDGNGFDAYVVASAEYVVKKPASLSFEQAAAMPTAVMTALHSIGRVARLQKGERVLVHASNDGVWLAAIQYAKHLGAEVFATAPSEERRAFLRARGVAHVYESLSPSWADDLKHDTGGRGIDLVVDSLDDDALSKRREQSLSVLAPFGRVVELASGTTSDQLSGPRGAMRSVTVNVVALSQLLAERRAASRLLLEDAFRLVDDGVLQPLPVESFPISQAVDAFEQLARARHVGRVVVHAEESVTVRDASRSAQIATDKTYLVTGGLGGLGLLAAGRLAKMGAKHLALMGRSAPSEKAKAAILALEATGTRVHVVVADASQRGSVERGLAELARSAPPVAGLVHAASIREEVLLPKLTAARLGQVLAPKVTGALTVSTLLPDVEMRVYFSSSAGTLGESGQAHLAAASAFTDAFAHYLHAQGKPALSVDWCGLGDESGARDEGSFRRGLGSIWGAQAAEIFERLLSSSKAQIAPIPFDFHQWRQANPRVAGLTLLRDLLAEAPRARAKQRAKNSNLLARLRTIAAVADRRALIINYLRESVANVLQSAPESIGLSVPFKQMGFDSLMVVRLKNTVERDLGVTVNATAVFAHPTVEQFGAHLADKVAASLGLTEPAIARAVTAPPPAKAPPPVKVELPVGDDAPMSVRSAGLALAEQLRLTDEELGDD